MSENKNKEKEIENSEDKETDVISKDTLFICGAILIAAIMICYFLRAISINVLY